MKRKPKKKIELTESEKVEKLASYGLTNKEISEGLGYDENTLKRNFEIFLIKGRANLKTRLRKKQISVALKGNVTMLIWLGKQYLSQAEKIEEAGDYEITIKRVDATQERSAKFSVDNKKRISLN
jgi:DNA-binding CsgD family transcriptional regulator